MGSEGNGFRVGRWRISSQSLDGEKLETSQWIMPKLRPTGNDVPAVKKSPIFLNAFKLENPGQRKPNIQGRHSKPSLSHMWLPKKNSANISPLQDGKTPTYL